MSKKQKPRAKHAQQPTALLCALVSEIDEPPVISRVDTCSGGCRKAVWRALSSPQTVRAICRHCMLLEVQFSGAKQIAVAPLTKSQRVDILSTADFIKRYEG